MKTLQERLRIKAGMITLGEKISWGSETALMYEAANKLDELEKQNDELRAKGYGGWDDPEQCPIERLQTMLNEHIAKGDPVDVGNFAMMLFNRNAPTVAPVVPDEMEIHEDYNRDEVYFSYGWNACRDAMLKGEK